MVFLRVVTHRPLYFKEEGGHTGPPLLIKRRKQFSDIDGCRTQLAYNNPGGVIRERCRFDHAGAGCQCARQSRNHRIARPRHIEHLLRNRGHVKRLVISLAEQHALISQRDQQQRGLQFTQQLFRCLQKRPICQWI